MRYLVTLLLAVSLCHSALASGYIQETKCSIVCTNDCEEGYVRVRDPKTLCHVYPCKCVEEEKKSSILKPGIEGKVLEGDIIVLPSQEEVVRGVYGEIPMEKSIFHIKKFYWTKYKYNGLYYIPYVMDNSLTDPVIRTNIPLAFEEFKQKTCIRFLRRSTQENYVRIKSGGGCYSHIGMNGGEQTVSLANRGCRPKGTAIHELMHTLGFFHEQSRPDRDDFITVNRWNIIKGLEDNFNKRSSAVSLGSPYDYGSVMHYGLDAFSRNGQDTIVPKRQTAEKIGQREGFSAIDIDQINRLYPCSQVSSSYEQSSTTQKPTTTTRRPYRPTTTTRRPYRPTTATRRPYRPTTATRRPYRPTTTTRRPYRPTTTTRRPYRPTTATRRPYRPITTTRRPYSPITTRRPYSPITTRRPYRPTNTTPYTKRPITKQPTTTPPKCKNFVPNCERWLNDGYCKHSSQYYKFAKQYCALTCDLCIKPDAKMEICMNKIKDTTCEGWKGKGYCIHTILKVYLKKNCAKTCNSCHENAQKDEDSAESAPMIQKDEMTFIMEDMINDLDNE